MSLVINDITFLNDKNIMITNLILKKYIDNFYNTIVYNIIDYNKKYKILENKLIEFNYYVTKDILNEINKDREQFTFVLKYVEDKNTKQIIIINKLIESYNISKNYKIQLNNIIDNLNSDSNFKDFSNIDDILFKIKFNILKDIQNILNNNKLYRIKTLGKKYYIERVKNNLKANNYFFEIQNYKDIIKEKIITKMNKIGLLNKSFGIIKWTTSKICTKYFPYIQFILFEISNKSFIMTKNFYNKHFNNIVIKIINKYKLKLKLLNYNNQNEYINLKKIYNNYYDNYFDTYSDLDSDFDEYNINYTNNVIIILFDYSNILSKKIDNISTIDYIKIIEHKFILKIINYMIQNNLKLC